MAIPVGDRVFSADVPDLFAYPGAEFSFASADGELVLSASGGAEGGFTLTVTAQAGNDAPDVEEAGFAEEGLEEALMNWVAACGWHHLYRHGHEAAPAGGGEARQKNVNGPFHACQKGERHAEPSV